MKYVVLINPLVYVSEGLRAALTPRVPHMHVAAVLGALVVLTSVFLALGIRSFMRKAVT
jgi:ABC-2 type transport system permease protein